MKKVVALAALAVGVVVGVYGTLIYIAYKLSENW